MAVACRPTPSPSLRPAGKPVYHRMTGSARVLAATQARLEPRADRGPPGNREPGSQSTAVVSASPFRRPPSSAPSPTPELTRRQSPISAYAGRSADRPNIVSVTVVKPTRRLCATALQTAVRLKACSRETPRIGTVGSSVAVGAAIARLHARPRADLNHRETAENDSRQRHRQPNLLHVNPLPA